MKIRRWLTISVLACAGLSLATPAVAAPPVRERAAAAGILQLQTVPAVAGIVVEVDGATARSDAQGRISIRVNNFDGLGSRLSVVPTQISPDRSVVFDRFRGDPDRGATGQVIEVGVRTSRLVSWRFVDRFGDDVAVDRVESMRLRSNTGEVFELTGPQLGQPLWVPETRTQQGPNGLVSKALYYVVDSAVVDGTSVVNRAQQRFVPSEQQNWVMQLLFYRVSFASTDLLFGTQTGSGIELTRPDGVVERMPFDARGMVSVADLPRGTYDVRVYGGGISFTRPVSISKDQPVTLQVITWLDLTVVVLIGLCVAVGLILLGRPPVRAAVRRLSRLAVHKGYGRWQRLPTRRRVAVVLVLVMVAIVGLTPAQPAHAGAPSTRRLSSYTEPVPVLAYYYIWYTPTSWNRGKIDYPLLGRYSSDDVEIMRQHVRMAKEAGVEGFLVSWKHTPQLDERLAKLVEVARSEEFRLGIVYQGLDFQRAPLSLETVAADLTLFANEYGNDAVFDIFGKPLVVWTGSDRQTRADIDATLSGVRGRLLILGNAKSVEDVDAMGPAMAGQAYYWSSVDPLNNTSGAKLSAMSKAVHERGGLWIAPVAPGFDARLVGGTTEVLRRDGDTLRASFEAARSSVPDAIGVISWNEFSENTHVEPSQRHGTTGLRVLATMLGRPRQAEVPIDSSDPVSEQAGLSGWGALVFAGSAVAVLAGLAAWRRRRWRGVPDLGEDRRH